MPLDFRRGSRRTARVLPAQTGQPLGARRCGNRRRPSGCVRRRQCQQLALADATPVQDFLRLLAAHISGLCSGIDLQAVILNGVVEDTAQLGVDVLEIVRGIAFAALAWFFFHCSRIFSICNMICFLDIKNGHPAFRKMNKKAGCPTVFKHWKKNQNANQ